jgi:ribose 5-phosphate isomerase B
MKEKTIAIAADHAGFKLKAQIIQYLKEQNHSIEDLGCESENSVDYPDYAQKLCLKMSLTKYKVGILICGSGIGMSVCANRFSYIRAALCLNEEMAELSRQHNDANVLVLGARITNPEIAIKCVDRFLSTSFISGRHQIRLDKINF